MRFSQNTEEEVIAKYFGDTIGTFLDIGANDGIILSNTRALALAGWKGLCVEPGAAFEKLAALYPSGEVCIANVAIGTQNGKAILHDSGTHLNKGDVSLLSTIEPKEKDRWVNTNTEWTEREVAVLTYKSLLGCSPYKTFDFISIDAEGLDFAILSQIDLTDTKCVCVEHNGNGELKRAIEGYCHGFELNNILLTNLENIIIAR